MLCRKPVPILWSSPRPTSRKPTASMHACESKAMASNGVRSCGVGSLGRLLAMYSERARALKTFPVFAAMIRVTVFVKVEVEILEYDEAKWRQTKPT